MSKRLFFILFLTAMLGIFASGWAATLSVPAQYGTIQAAIDAAAAGDIVDIAAGTYTVTAAVTVNKQLTVQGAGIGQTFVQTAATTTDPVNVFAVSASNVTLKNMTIQQRKTSNSSVESVVSVTFPYPWNNNLDAFRLESCRLETMEFCITIRGQNWTITGCQLAYTGPLANNHRLIGVYGNAGISNIENNSFECSVETARTVFIYSTSSDGSEQNTGTLNISGNTHTSGDLKQFYLQDNLNGSAFTLKGLNNTFSAVNADFALYGVTPLNLFTAITLTGNQTSNAGGKGLLGLDGGGPLGSAGSTTLTMASNTLTNTAVTKVGWAEATGSTGGLVGYNTAVFTDPNVTILNPNVYQAGNTYSFTVHAPNSADGAEAKIWGFYKNTSNAWVSATFGTGTFTGGYATVSYTLPANFLNSLYWEVLAYESAGSQTRSILWNPNGPWGQYDTYMLNGQTIEMQTYGFGDFSLDINSASYKLTGAGSQIPAAVDYSTVDVVIPWSGSINDYNNDLYNNETLYRKVGLYPTYATDRGYTVEVLASNPSSPNYQQIKISKPSIGFEAILFGLYLETPSDPAGHMWWCTFPKTPVSSLEMVYNSSTGECSGTFSTPLSYNTQYFIQPYAEINIPDSDLVYCYEPGSMNLILSGRELTPIHNVTRDVYFDTIQGAINAAVTQNGDVIEVAAGTYVENITINKELTINGAGQGATIIVPATSAPGAVDGPSYSGSQVVIVSAHNVTISNLTVDGNNPAITSGITVNGVDIDARNGIIESDGPWNNLHVANVTVQNIFLRGIYTRSGGTGFHIEHNTVQNVAGGYSSIAIFSWMGSGIIEYNNVSLANDAISSNHSKGLQILHNTITNCASGIHTDNNGSSGGVADEIAYNNVSNSPAGGYGIWTFFSYLNIQVHDNTVNDVDISLFHWGGPTTPGTISYVNNSVDNLNKPNAIGMYLTTGDDAWLSWMGSANLTLSGNTVTNTAYGLILEYEAGFYLNVTGGTGNSFDGTLTDIAVCGLGTLTSSGLAGNLVDVWNPGKVQDGVLVAAANGTVNVAAGLYLEDVLVNKHLTLLGAKADIPRNTGSDTDWTTSTTAAWDNAAAVTAGESVLRSVNTTTTLSVIDIAEDCNVTVKGFVIEARNRTDGANRHLLYVAGKNTTINTINIQNNIIGPITGDAQDGSKGRMGISLDSQSGGPNGLSGTISGNKIFGAEGNGDAVFIIGQHYYPSMSDYSGMTVSSNDIYGTNRTCVELAGGIDGITVQNNYLSRAGYIWNGTAYTESAVSLSNPTKLTYGSGICLIRTGTICASPLTSQNYVENSTISGNTIANCAKNGIYGEAMLREVSLTGNTISGSGWNGIWIDESGTYNTGKAYALAYGCSEEINITGNNLVNNANGSKFTGRPPLLTFTNNNISGNASYGAIQDDGIGDPNPPSPDYYVNAVKNWWGHADGPTPPGMRTGDAVTIHILYDPWWANAEMTILGSDAPVRNITKGTYYNTIQAAVTDAITTDGDTITVAAGTYVEVGQILINKDLTIVGEDKLTTIVKPANDTAGGGSAQAFIFVESGKTLNLSNFTIDCDGRLVRNAIRLQGSGSIDNNIIKNVYYSHYNAWGIAYDYSVGSQAWSITNNTFQNIERVCILVDGQTNTATITGNEFIGKGSGDYVNYGIETGDGAISTISSNSFTGFQGVASSDGSESACVMVSSYFGPNPYISVTGNILNNSSFGVMVGYNGTDTSDAAISGNTFS